MSRLSERVRPVIEAAGWIIEEIKNLEASLEKETKINQDLKVGMKVTVKGKPYTVKLGETEVTGRTLPITHYYLEGENKEFLVIIDDYQKEPWDIRAYQYYPARYWVNEQDIHLSCD